MIRNYATKKTKFVRMKVSAPDGRFSSNDIFGGLELQSALYQAKQYPQAFIIDIFDTKN